ncbi:MAG: hypothetical protein C4576_20680 [Desulfobacteraceae bacterium]|nr:MAG: hypothetical protein C4576_20680 [Desulfobacteraceae bacterium]
MSAPRQGKYRPSLKLFLMPGILKQISAYAMLQNILREGISADALRWKHIRNTPFRKSIETIGSPAMDILTLKVLGHTKIFSRRGSSG